MPRRTPTRSAEDSRNQTPPSGATCDPDAVDVGRLLGGETHAGRHRGRQRRASASESAAGWASGSGSVRSTRRTPPSHTAAAARRTRFMTSADDNAGAAAGISPIAAALRLGVAMSPVRPVAEVLARRTAPAAPELVESLPDGRLRCLACGHRCPIPEGARGRLQGPLQPRRRARGAVGLRRRRSQCDPIEKKPFFHVLPGSRRALLRHARLRPALRVLPELGHLAGAARPGGRRARRRGRRRPASSSRLALAERRADDRQRPTTSRSSPPSGRSRSSGPRRRRACGPAFVSNGNGTPEVLDYLRPVDRPLQGRPEVFRRHATTASSAASCRPCSTRSRDSHERGIWVEVVTLLMPGFNDSDEELTRARGFLAGDLAATFPGT